MSCNPPLFHGTITTSTSSLPWTFVYSNTSKDDLSPLLTALSAIAVKLLRNTFVEVVLAPGVTEPAPAGVCLPRPIKTKAVTRVAPLHPANVAAGIGVAVVELCQLVVEMVIAIVI